MEYAANFSVTWNTDRIRSAFEERCRRDKIEPAQEASKLAVSPEEFKYEVLWEQVSANLKDGTLRLVVVADEIPATTLRIVEFLNGRMEKTDVYAVKVSQHVGGGVRTLSTSVLNASQETVEKKELSRASSPGAQWTPARFYEELQKRTNSEAAAIFHEIHQWAESTDNVIPYFGEGLQDGSIQVTALRKPPHYNSVTDLVFLTLWTGGTAEICFQYIAKKPPFDSADLRDHLKQRLNAIPGVSLMAEQVTKRPQIGWEKLKEPESLRTFLSVQDWLVATCREAWRNGTPGNDS